MGRSQPCHNLQDGTLGGRYTSAKARQFQLQREWRGKGGARRSFIHSFLNLVNTHFLRTCLSVLVPVLSGVKGSAVKHICRQDSAPLGSGRAGVKASCSHVRAPYDRATHPTSLPVSLTLPSACLCMLHVTALVPLGTGPASLLPPQEKKSWANRWGDQSSNLRFPPHPHARRALRPWLLLPAQRPPSLLDR